MFVFLVSVIPEMNFEDQPLCNKMKRTRRGKRMSRQMLTRNERKVKNQVIQNETCLEIQEKGTVSNKLHCRVPAPGAPYNNNSFLIEDKCYNYDMEELDQSLYSMYFDESMYGDLCNANINNNYSDIGYCSSQSMTSSSSTESLSSSSPGYYSNDETVDFTVRNQETDLKSQLEKLSKQELVDRIISRQNDLHNM